jgi:hypothetical protein
MCPSPNEPSDGISLNQIGGAAQGSFVRLGETLTCATITGRQVYIAGHYCVSKTISFALYSLSLSSPWLHQIPVHCNLHIDIRLLKTFVLTKLGDLLTLNCISCLT